VSRDDVCLDPIAWPAAFGGALAFVRDRRCEFDHGAGSALFRLDISTPRDFMRLYESLSMCFSLLIERRQLVFLQDFQTAGTVELRTRANRDVHGEVIGGSLIHAQIHG
jgi:hypothetical protein